jgi:excisionase family DNA binding protein
MTAFSSFDDLVAMSVEEACRRSGLGRTGMYAAMRDGLLVPVRIGKRTLIEAAELRRFLAANRAGAAA